MGADVVLRGGRVLDVFGGRFVNSDVAIREGRITGFHVQDADTVYDASGAWILPGLIDTHVHIESSHLAPNEFARVVVPHGTTAVIADPHEIANVFGSVGVRWMIDAAQKLPLRVFFMAPSCVPSCPFDASGATLDAAAVREMLSWDGILGLGEMMNYPGVLARDPEVWAKLDAARGRPIDGHAPGLGGDALSAYVAAGPRTDHESTTLAEASEKLRAGMHVLMRDASSARDIVSLLPLLGERTAPFVHFCTDDRHAETILEYGHIRSGVRQAIESGVPAPVAVAAASLYAARAYGLSDLGAIAPGYRADLLVVDDLETLSVRNVFVDGRVVAGSDGSCTAACPPHEGAVARRSMNLEVSEAAFRIDAASHGSDTVTIRVIDVASDQILTGDSRASVCAVSGEIRADIGTDLLKAAVVERHRGTGRVGVGVVRGFGLQAGAIASSVAHDAHNIVVVGTNDRDMAAAVNRLAALGGGQIVVRGGEVVSVMALPIAGLMSERPAADVAAAERALRDAAHQLGSPLGQPFMTLSFLALPVIPHLKLTDGGLVDVDRFERVSVIASS